MTFVWSGKQYCECDTTCAAVHTLIFFFLLHEHKINLKLMDLNFLQVVRRAEEASYFCLFRSRDFRICPKEARALFDEAQRRSSEGAR